MHIYTQTSERPNAGEGHGVKLVDVMGEFSTIYVWDVYPLTIKQNSPSCSFAEKADAFLTAIPACINEYNKEAYTRLTKTCLYCKTEGEDMNCLNCGAPRE